MPYKARQGDIILLTFDPQAGHEQTGRRPALVVSNNKVNNYFAKTQPAAMVCPITNTDKNLPIQPRLDERTKTGGVIICDQAKFVDLTARGAMFLEQAPEDIVFEAVDIIIGFVEI